MKSNRVISEQENELFVSELDRYTMLVCTLSHCEGCYSPESCEIPIICSMMRTELKHHSQCQKFNQCSRCTDFQTLRIMKESYYYHRHEYEEIGLPPKHTMIRVLVDLSCRFLTRMESRYNAIEVLAFATSSTPAADTSVSPPPLIIEEDTVNIAQPRLKPKRKPRPKKERGQYKCGKCGQVKLRGQHKDCPYKTQNYFGEILQDSRPKKRTRTFSESSTSDDSVTTGYCLPCNQVVTDNKEESDTDDEYEDDESQGREEQEGQMQEAVAPFDMQQHFHASGDTGHLADMHTERNESIANQSNQNTFPTVYESHMSTYCTAEKNPMTYCTYA